MNKIIQNGESFGFGTDNASGVNYNNTSSGLTSTTVQGAIDEVNSNLTQLFESGTNYIKFSNGTLIQWGKSTGSTWSVQITLTQPFKDTNYVVTIAPIATVGAHYSHGYTIDTNSLFYLYTNSTDNHVRCSWLAIGKWK